MIEKTKPAFPKPGQNGMTLRDYFAAKAMQAMLSNPYTGQQFHRRKLTKEAQIESIVSNSYAMADAMLEAGNNDAHCETFN